MYIFDFHRHLLIIQTFFFSSWPLYEYFAVQQLNVSSQIQVLPPHTSIPRQNPPLFSELQQEMKKDTDQLLKLGGYKVRNIYFHEIFGGGPSAH